MPPPQDGESDGEALEEGELPYRAPEPPAWPQPDATGEQLLSARDGRAPFFAAPGVDGFLGRPSKRRKKAKKAAKAHGYVDIYGKGAAASIDLYSEQGPIKLAGARRVAGGGGGPGGACR